MCRLKRAPFVSEWEMSWRKGRKRGCGRKEGKRGCGREESVVWEEKNEAKSRFGIEEFACELVQLCWIATSTNWLWDSSLGVV